MNFNSTPKKNFRQLVLSSVACNQRILDFHNFKTQLRANQIVVVNQEPTLQETADSLQIMNCWETSELILDNVKSFPF